MKTDTKTLADALRAGHSAIAAAPATPMPTRAARIKALEKAYRITCKATLAKASDATLAVLERAAQAAPTAPSLGALIGKGQ